MGDSDFTNAKRFRRDIHFCPFLMGGGTKSHATCSLGAWHVQSLDERTVPWQAKPVCSLTRSYFKVLPKEHLQFQRTRAADKTSDFSKRWIISLKSSNHGLHCKINHVQSTFLGQEETTTEWSLMFIPIRPWIQDNFPPLQFMFHTSSVNHPFLLTYF